MTFVILMIIVMLSVSCTEKESITVSKSSLEWTTHGGRKTAEVAANCSWTITAPEWVTVEPSSGTGNSNIVIRAAKNDDMERSGTLIIASGDAMAEIALNQAGVDVRIEQTEFEFSMDGAPIEFDIISTCEWKIDISREASWVSAEPLSGKAGETRVRLTPAPFSDRTPRDRARLTVNYATGFTMLTVSQPLPNSAPSKPELIAPEDGIADTRTNPYFSWKPSTDPDGDKVSYRLMISDDNGNSWSTTSTTDLRTKSNYGLARNTPHLWKVQAVDALGAAADSHTRSFTTGDGGVYEDGEVSLVQTESAGADSPVHLIFMGDGFIEEDYAEGGAFDQAVEQAVNSLFSVEPYAAYRDYFRISTVAVYSQERGATVKNDMTSVGRQNIDTAFESVLEGGNSTSVDCDYQKVFSYAVTVPGVTQEALQNTTVFLLINIDAYAGTCMMEYTGRSVAMCPMGRNSFDQVVIHEGGGHGFGRLLDEYRYHADRLPDDEKENLNAWRMQDPYFGYNIDITGDRSKVHWRHYFDRSGYEAVGLFEGGYYYDSGVWRPETISCMDDNRSYYNAPSREAIVRRIMRASGGTFRMEDFIKNDKVRKDPTTKASNYVEAFVPFASPILIGQ